MYKYETHLHTHPVSKCARSTAREYMELYKELGYDGIFITNHFLDGNINIDYNVAYEEKINFYFSDYEEAKKLENEIGIKIFCGVELSYKGTDFLIYGLDKAWYLAHPEIMDMKKSDELLFMAENGALVIQTHPYREAAYIDHIRLFPKHVHGVEVINACRSEFENNMAKIYAQNYNLIEFAGTDIHLSTEERIFAGMCSDAPVIDENDFISRVKNGQMKIFSMNTEKRD